jgi:DNA-directed RNA polymerase specialized sigma24 family protein
LDLDKIAQTLSEQYDADLVQEMLLKLWRAKGEVRNPVAYAKSCWRTIMAERHRDRLRQPLHLIEEEGEDTPQRADIAHDQDPLARAIAVQGLERVPEALLADELGIRPLTKIQRHRARKRGKHVRQR